MLNWKSFQTPLQKPKTNNPSIKKNQPLTKESKGTDEKASYYVPIDEFTSNLIFTPVEKTLQVPPTKIHNYHG